MTEVLKEWWHHTYHTLCNFNWSCLITSELKSYVSMIVSLELWKGNVVFLERCVHKNSKRWTHSSVSHHYELINGAFRYNNVFFHSSELILDLNGSVKIMKINLNRWFVRAERVRNKPLNEKHWRACGSDSLVCDLSPCRCAALLPSPSWGAWAWRWSCGRALGVTTSFPSSGILCATWLPRDPRRSTWAEPPASSWSSPRTRAWRKTQSSWETGDTDGRSRETGVWPARVGIFEEFKSFNDIQRFVGGTFNSKIFQSRNVYSALFTWVMCVK